MNKKKNKCNIVKDLIPLYIDEICSDDTKEFVENELNKCEECNEFYKLLKKDIDLKINNQLPKNKFKKIKNKIRMKYIISTIAVILVIFPLIVLSLGQLKLPCISFSSIPIMNKANKFYNGLKNYDIETVDALLSNDKEMWFTHLTNYTREDFLNNIKKLEQEKIEFVSFTPQKFWYNGMYLVNYELCAKDKNEKACIIIETFINSNNELGYWGYGVSRNTELEKKIVDIFNPVRNI